jgi:hypothetical protein
MELKAKLGDVLRFERGHIGIVGRKEVIYQAPSGARNTYGICSSDKDWDEYEILFNLFDLLKKVEEGE